jgi:hypothetical protein
VLADFTSMCEKWDDEKKKKINTFYEDSGNSEIFTLKSKGEFIDDVQSQVRNLITQAVLTLNSENEKDFISERIDSYFNSGWIK